MLRATPLLAALATSLLMASCGGSTSASSSTSAGTTAASGATTEGGGALSADAKSAATGDIPDTQNFLTLSDPTLRVSMLYPEGWTVSQTASEAKIEDKNNLVRIQLTKAAAPTLASVQAQLRALARSTPSLVAGKPSAIQLKRGPALRAVYSTLSAPNPVTGKRVKLSVDRYVLAHAGRVAVVDLGTPVGVDNIDAYKRMIESFKWR
jgi:hypothetical protein